MEHRGIKDLKFASSVTFERREYLIIIKCNTRVLTVAKAAATDALGVHGGGVVAVTAVPAVGHL